MCSDCVATKATITDGDVAEVFEQAADNMLIRGWSQANLGFSGTAQCLDGHLMTACDFKAAPNPLYSKVREAFADYVRNTTGQSSIWVFNDVVVKDAGEARDHLLLAAKELRNNA